MPTKDEVKYKVGDKVKVVNPGRCYTTYETMFKHMGFKNEHYNSDAVKGNIGTVFFGETEDPTGRILIGIELEDGRQVLIDDLGIRPVTTEKDESDCIYRKGDTVYHYLYGKGNIDKVKVHGHHNYPIVVKFQEFGRTKTFTICGSDLARGFPVLSFTEYSLKDGGFSQERPIPEIELPFINTKWKYFTKEGTIITLWVNKPKLLNYFYSSNGDRSYDLSKFILIDVKDGVYKIKR